MLVHDGLLRHIRGGRPSVAQRLAGAAQSRMWPGIPCSRNRSISTSMTWIEFRFRPIRMVRHARVNSSSTLSNGGGGGQGL